MLGARTLRRAAAPVVAMAVVGGGSVLGVTGDLGDIGGGDDPVVRPAAPTTSTRTATGDREPALTRRAESPMDRVRRIVLRDTNEARAAEGLPALRQQRRMNEVAQRWSRRQASDSAMSHNPDVGDQIPPGWSTWAENVAYGYSVRRVVPAWLASPGHRENIMRDVNRIGIGMARAEDGTRFYTQVFAKY